MEKFSPPDALRLLLAVLTLGGGVFAAPKKPVKTPEPPPPLAPGELPLAARAALSLDLATGAVLYEKNADAMEYPASATKILTALLVIEAGNLDARLTVEEVDTKVEPTALYIKPGETFVRRHLLHVLLLKSANDVAMALARDNAGSVEAFADKMTRRAAALGAVSSNFKNPHGLHEPHHFTTARDLARIAHEAMKVPLFREIVATPEIVFLKDDEWIRIRNHNRLIGKFAGCCGVKTGYTVKAQQVLVSAASRGGKDVLSVVLHTDKPGIWDDSMLLLTHGFAKSGLAPQPGDPALPPLALDGAAPVVAPPVSPPAPAAPTPPGPAETKIVPPGK